MVRIKIPVSVMNKAHGTCGLLVETNRGRIDGLRFCVGEAMTSELFSSELRDAQERRLHWHAEYAEAIAMNDCDRAASALQHLQTCNWLIQLVEGTRNVSFGL